MGPGRCDACRRVVDELHVSLAAGGRSVCEGCYCALPTAQLQPSPPGVKLRTPKLSAPEPWVTRRLQIIDLMIRDGGWHYIDHDRCIGTCPVCLDRTLSVRFLGHTLDLELACRNGCEPAAIVPKLGKAWL